MKILGLSEGYGNEREDYLRVLGQRTNPSEVRPGKGFVSIWNMSNSFLHNVWVMVGGIEVAFYVCKHLNQCGV